MENIQTIKDFEELYKTVMGLYWTFLSEAEKIVQLIPESETEMLNDINKAMEAVTEAMKHDVALFEGAVSEDQEAVNKIKEGLQIQNIYKSLNKNG